MLVGRLREACLAKYLNPPRTEIPPSVCQPVSVLLYPPGKKRFPNVQYAPSELQFVVIALAILFSTT